MISNFPLFISLVELAEQMHKANVFFAVRILFTYYSLNIINTSFKLHLFKKNCNTFVLYLCPHISKFKKKKRRKEEGHTDLLLRYINIGNFNQDSLGVLNQDDF